MNCLFIIIDDDQESILMTKEVAHNTQPILASATNYTDGFKFNIRIPSHIS
jgi:hypothetical protein